MKYLILISLALILSACGETKIPEKVKVDIDVNNGEPIEFITSEGGIVVKKWKIGGVNYTRIENRTSVIRCVAETVINTTAYPTSPVPLSEYDNASSVDYTTDMIAQCERPI